MRLLPRDVRGAVPTSTRATVLLGPVPLAVPAIAFGSCEARSTAEGLRSVLPGIRSPSSGCALLRLELSHAGLSGAQILSGLKTGNGRSIAACDAEA